MPTDGPSLSAGADGFVAIRCQHQRRVLLAACDWLIGYERQSQRDGLLPEEVDRSLDQLSDARALRQRLRHDGRIDELAERLQDAARRTDGGRVFVELSELLGQLERLPEAGNRP